MCMFCCSVVYYIIIAILLMIDNIVIMICVCLALIKCIRFIAVCGLYRAIDSSTNCSNKYNALCKQCVI